VQASPGPEFKRLGTGGSWSVGGSWKPLRNAGAAAREMLLSAAAARWNVERAECAATSGAVTHGPTGRRLGYGELVADASKLPVPGDPPLKPAGAFRLIGQRQKRIDAQDIVTGVARYGIDTRRPGMLYATIERPPSLGAQPRSWNEKAVREVRGVRAVLPVSSGVAVVADSTWASLKGRAALGVVWNENAGTAFDSTQHYEHLEAAAREPGFTMRKEEAPAGTGPVTRTVEATYLYPFYAHAPLETMNCVADAADDRCKIWAPTQAPNGLQEAVAKQLGIPSEKVEVNVTLIGGGFGRRLANDYALEAAEISRVMVAPVQVLWSRADDMGHGHFQGASAHRLSGGFDAAGKLVAWHHTKAGSFHNLSGPPKPEELKDVAYYHDSSWGVYDVPYAVPSIQTAYVAVDLPVKHGPWRAVFAPSSVFAREAFVDELARAAGADPIAFRLELLSRGADTVKAGEHTIDRRRLRRVLELVRDKSGWDGKPLPKGRGRGVACNIYEGETTLAYVVDVTVAADGNVHVDRVVAAVDCGLVVNPLGVEQQIEGGVIWGISSALKGDISFRRGRAQETSYADFGVARMADAPASIETHIVPSLSAQPTGMGEPPVPPIIPAITNAIFAATGKAVRRLPVRATDLR
jgi:isoquinoline 1-oxidoreductase beta subunit